MVIKQDPVIAHHPSTRAEFQQMRAALFERKRTLQNEGAANYAAMKSGSPPSRPLSDHERRVTAHIQLLMNGSTPPHLLMPAATRDEQIRSEIDAIDFVERDLGRQEELVLQREAEQWVFEHAAEWRALCREIVLAAVRLAALEDRARAAIEPIQSRPSIGGLAMGSSIGSGLSLLGIGDPLLDLRSQALKEGVVTNAEIRKAANVE
jgi:hypothetical protein